jgi:molecular chaperone GrpE (heat shock protein)/8-oxo-dGTP pyrophosphatase MutT (NUDIX family)
MFIKELTEKEVGLPITAGVRDETAVTRIAVKGIVQNSEWKIAMVQYSIYPWASLPGGGVDGEMLDVAFRREILEEVGADITDVVPLGITREYRTYNGEKEINHTTIFASKVVWDLHKLTLSQDELDEWHAIVWMTLDEAKSLLRASLLEDLTYGGRFVINRDLFILEEYTSYLAQNAKEDPKIKELEEIAKKAQYDYIMLKSEFDSYVRRMESDAKEGKVGQLVELAKKLLPIIDQLWQSVAHIPTELLDNNWVSGVKLTYENAIKILQGLGISQIATIGEAPDMELHDPLSVEPVEDKSMKGKIIKEFQPGYVYEKDGIKKVISAAKVIVGQ